MGPEILLITGAAGVGKSSASWEVCEELKRRGLPHAAIDTDELDRVWPLPYEDPRRRELNVANLSSWWSRYEQLALTRLVLAGVFVDIRDAVAWISEAITGATITAVRLVVTDDTLRQRVARREIGTAGDDQTRRSVVQAAAIAAQARGDEVAVRTDDLAVPELAVCLCDLMGWHATRR